MITSIINFINNLNPFLNLIIGGGIALYLIDIYRQRKKQKRLVIKLKKEVAFELFSEERVLSSIISDFSSLLRDPIGLTTAHWFSLNISAAMLSSGHFIHFESELNYFLFDMHFIFKKIQYELDNFLKLPDAYKKSNIPLLEDGKRHSIEAFNRMHNSKIYLKLKKLYLREWLTKILPEGDIPKDLDIPKNDKDIIESWTNKLRIKAGLT